MYAETPCPDMNERKTVLSYVGAVGLGLLSLLTFGAVLGLGIWGIVVAKDLNLCDRSNATDECVFETPLTAPLNANDTQPTPDVTELEWTYYLIGSTVAAVSWAILTTLSLLFVVHVLRHRQQKELEKISRKHKSLLGDIELTEQGRGGTGREGGERAVQEEGEVKEKEKVEDAGVRRERLSDLDEPDVTKGTTEQEGGGGELEDVKSKLVDAGIQRKHLPGVDESDHAEVKIDYIGAYHVREWHRKPLRHLGPWGFLTLLCSLLTLIMSLMCLLWAVALGYYHTNRVEKQLSAFFLVEFLAGFLLPLLLFISSVLLAIVVEYVTIGRVDARKRIKRFLPTVVFEEGVESDYWVIEERFYFKLRRRDKHLTKNHGFWYSCDKSLSTWLLTGIVALSLLLSFSYFVDISVVEEETRSSCPVNAVEYDCFNRTSFNFVDCGDNEESERVELIHCFRFLRFAVDTNLITSFAQAFAFYLATVAVFGRVFSAVKTLLHLHRTRLWGMLFLVLGSTTFIITIIFLAIEDRFQIQVNVLSVLQVCMACLFIILVGVLVLKGNWYEKIFDGKKVKPLAELLLHYDHISGAEVHEIEHSYAAQVLKDDPTSVHVVDTTA